MNKRERDIRFSALRRIGCMCCRKNRTHGLPGTSLPVDVHHLNQGGVHGGKRLGDDKTIPLCRWHHAGSFNEQAAPGGFDGLKWQDKQAAIYGPSWAMGSKKFRLAYGSDADLLALADKLIECVLGYEPA